MFIFWYIHNQKCHGWNQFSESIIFENKIECDARWFHYSEILQVRYCIDCLFGVCMLKKSFRHSIDFALAVCSDTCCQTLLTAWPAYVWSNTTFYWLLLSSVCSNTYCQTFYWLVYVQTFAVRHPVDCFCLVCVCSNIHCQTFYWLLVWCMYVQTTAVKHVLTWLNIVAVEKFDAELQYNNATTILTLPLRNDIKFKDER